MGSPGVSESQKVDGTEKESKFCSYLIFLPSARQDYSTAGPLIHHKGWPLLWAQKQPFRLRFQGLLPFWEPYLFYFAHLIFFKVIKK